ncbi:MAG: cytochrome c3 family protein [Candidatus Methylomirabilales bacterium]
MRRLFGNTLSLIGVLIAGASFVINVFLLLADFLAPRSNPYLGIFTYMIIPGITIAGIGLIALGAALRYMRLRRGGEVEELPRLDLNDRRHRVTLALGFLVLILFLGFSAVGGYQAYQFTETTTFCGQVCHSVMKPEFTAYQSSPHARVSCVECHIGPGAEWFVKSKLSGAYQVYSVLFNKYSRPIPTPIRDLRPAQETCEHCHWPAKFWGEQLATRVHFASDKENSRREVSLLMKTGGGSIKGLSRGIHWHMNIANKVSYIATDERRQVIPWVRLEEPDGKVTEFVSSETPITREQIQRGETRRMDCMDCHNRPSHQYLPPGRALDFSFLAGRIPRDLPFIKKVAVEAMVQPYATQAEAERGIAQAIRGFYQQNYPKELAGFEPRLAAAIQEVVEVYRHNFFPEMKVDWQAYPDNIGHKEFPGCFRCHDGKHVSKDGRTISHDCAACHDFLEQRQGGLVRVEATHAFAHPWKLAGRHTEIRCGACHTGGPAKPATCRGCHAIPASGAPMAGMECKECHTKVQQREPLTECGACHADVGGLHKAEPHAAADCTSCHPAHAWAPKPREQCQACHQDKTEHYPGEACAKCHEFRS